MFARTSSRIIARAGGAGLAAAVAAGLVLAAQTTSGAVTPHGSIGASTQFYVDPNSQVQRWDAANPADSREPAIAQRNELVARRWLPAIDLSKSGPALIGVAAARTGECVWHAYEDLGDRALESEEGGHDRRAGREFDPLAVRVPEGR